MKKIYYFIILTLVPLFVQEVFPQTTFTVNVANFSFTPAQLTIKVGDTVKWTNSGGLHSVVAEDTSFSSGPVSSSAWTYEHTFNSAGSNPYYCAQHGGVGGAGMSGVITVENATDVSDNGFPIYHFELQQNYPNPFNPSTTIKYSIPESGNVKLVVYNSLGEEVATVVNGFESTGSYKVNFNSYQLSSGIYFYRLKAGTFVEVKKMLILK
ncbi:MAG: T9SS type A sorting domain-containing protein [Ignavibacteriota bacterium]